MTIFLFCSELAKAHIRLNADVGPKPQTPTLGLSSPASLSLSSILPSSIKEGDWSSLGASVAPPQQNVTHSTNHYLGRIQSFLANPLVWIAHSKSDKLSWMFHFVVGASLWLRTFFTSPYPPHAYLFTSAYRRKPTHLQPANILHGLGMND